jgi:DNA invertase Pin-like site-specific DNA recombinase
MATRPPIKAFSYRRISTPEQARGHGLTRQLEASREYAERHGLDLQEGDQLVDLGISAFRGKNVLEGALGKFLNATKAGRIPAGSILIVESLDRLSRDRVRKAATIFFNIIDAGVSIHTMSDGRTYTPEDTRLEDIIMSLVIMSRANEDSETKSLRVASAWANKRKNADSRPLTAMCPAWLRLKKDRSRYELIPEKAKVVRDIFDDCVAGIGVYTITRRLNERRVPAFRGANGWTLAYVLKILRWRATIGEYQMHRIVDRRRVPEGDPVKEYFPPAVSEEVFYRAQHGLNQRVNHAGGSGPRGDRVNNLFMGLLTCSYCRSTMRFEAKGGRNKNSIACNGARRGMGCKIARWRYEDFETSFLSFCAEVDLGAIVDGEAEAGRRKELEDSITATRGRLVELTTRTEGLLELLADGNMKDVIRKKMKELEAENARLGTELEEKEKERDALDARRASVNDVKDLIRKVQSSDEGEDTYRLRASVAARLRSIVDTVMLAPLGNAPSTRKAIEFLKEQEHPDAEAVIKNLEAGIDGRRYFVVVLKDGSMRAVYPDPDDATRFTMQVTSSADAGLVRHLPAGSEVVFSPEPSDAEVKELLRRVRDQS